MSRSSIYIYSIYRICRCNMTINTWMSLQRWKKDASNENKHDSHSCSYMQVCYNSMFYRLQGDKYTCTWTDPWEHSSWTGWFTGSLIQTYEQNIHHILLQFSWTYKVQNFKMYVPQYSNYKPFKTRPVPKNFWITPSKECITSVMIFIRDLKWFWWHTYT